MEPLNISAIRAALAERPDQNTRELELPEWGYTLTLRRLTMAELSEIGSKDTSRERLGAMIKRGVLSPKLSDSDIAVLFTAPEMAPLARAITAAINEYNQSTRPPDEYVAEAHASFRPWLDGPDAPDGPRPLRV